MYEQPSQYRPVAGCLAVVGIACFAFVWLGVLTPTPSQNTEPSSRSSTSAPRYGPTESRPLRTCDQPIGWYIGSLDSRFGVTRSEVRQAVEDAVDVWEGWWGGDLFVYDESGPLPIHFEFDQKLAQLYAETTRYEAALEAYNRDVDAFNEQASRHEQRVREWNRHPGTPAQRTRLEREGRRLESVEMALRQRERELERNRPRGVMKRVNLADWEGAIEPDRFGNPIQIIQRSITVYHFDDLNHLVLILAHELGHALGIIDHVDDPAAVMHEEPQFPRDGWVRLSAADRDALREICGEPLVTSDRVIDLDEVLEDWKMRTQPMPDDRGPVVEGPEREPVDPLSGLLDDSGRVVEEPEREPVVKDDGDTEDKPVEEADDEHVEIAHDERHLGNWQSVYDYRDVRFVFNDDGTLEMGLSNFMVSGTYEIDYDVEPTELRATLRIRDEGQPHKTLYLVDFRSENQVVLVEWPLDVYPPRTISPPPIDDYVLLERVEN